MFKLITEDPATKTQVYSDGMLNVTVVLPQHHASGIPLQISVAPVEKSDDHGVPENNAIVEGEDQPPSTHEEFEKLGQ